MPYRFTAPISMYVDPQRAKIAELQTRRYEENFAADSLLDQQLNRMLVSPLPNDQKLAKTLREQFGKQLEERASRGDYHNMSRQVMLDANQFVKNYTPLKQNYEAYMGYRQGLAEKVEKGDITQDIANNSLAYSTYGNQGLELDASGSIAYNSYFTGYKPADYVDLRELSFEIASKIKKEKYGGQGDIRQSAMGNGLYDIVIEGQTVETITPERIRAAINPLQADPKVQAYLNQEAMFRLYRDSNEVVGAKMAQYADQLRTQASATENPYQKGLLEEAANEVEAVLAQGGDLKPAMAQIIKQTLFDQGTQSAVNTFAFRSVFGGGVKSAKVNKVWFEQYKQNVKDLSGVSSPVMFERQNTEGIQGVKQLIQAKRGVIQSNIDFLKDLGVSLTEEQLVDLGGKISRGELSPEQIEQLKDLDPTIRQKVVNAVTAASSEITAYQALIGEAEKYAAGELNQRLAAIAEDTPIANKMVQDAGISSADWANISASLAEAGITKDQILEFLKGRAIPAGTESLGVDPDDYVTSAEPVFSKIVAERASGAGDVGYITGTSRTYTFDNVGLDELIERGELSQEQASQLLNLRQSVMNTPYGEFYDDTVDQFDKWLGVGQQLISDNVMNNYLQESKFPSVAGSATSAYKGATEINKVYGDKPVPSNLSFTTATGREITGAELAGYKIQDRGVRLINGTLGGNVGFAVYLEPIKGQEKVASNTADKHLDSGNLVYLFGSQLNTAGLSEIVTSPATQFQLLRNNNVRAGQSQADIPLPSGYTIRLDNIGTNQETMQLLDVNGNAYKFVPSIGGYSPVRTTPDDLSSKVDANGPAASSIVNMPELYELALPAEENTTE